MRTLYELLKRVSLGIKAMTETMSEYLRSRGRALVEDYIGGNDAQQQPLVTNNIPTSSTASAVTTDAASGAGSSLPVTANPIVFVQVWIFFFF